jgi:TonB-dependent SusC/RagA subfamily outer membrane receptor
MRKVFIFFLLLASVICFSQNAAVTTLDKALANKMPSCGLVEAKPVPEHCILRCPATKLNSNPLIVVDGIPLPEENDFSIIDTNNTLSIEILKPPTSAVIYGYQGANGAILITTKHSAVRKFIIKDSIYRNRIAGATVSFTSKNNKDTFQFAANDSGIVETDRLKKGAIYDLVISSVGYQTIKEKFENGNNYLLNEILLERDIKTCQEVIISNTNCMMCGGTTLYCMVSGMYITGGRNPDKEKKILLPQFKLYPNPVQKGGVIHIEMTSADNKPIKLNLLSQGGQLVFLQEQELYKGANSFTINTDSRWAAGIYFVRLVYENGRVLASEKIIIQ